MGNGPLYDRVVHSINNRRGPVILVVQSNLIPWGAVGEGSNWLGHYLVVYGYRDGDYDGDGPQYLVWDPASDRGDRVLSANDWQRIAYFHDDPVISVPGSLISQVIVPRF
jgi:hypothetical protein